jgi:sulfur relay (sulfurtransferase) complex TusBCD TusD component (DsrE family)
VKKLALIVRGLPYGRRSARSDLDLALAAAALDFRVDVFFLGGAVMQLAARRDAGGALLPAGYRAWASLCDNAEFRVYAEKCWLDFCVERDIGLLMPVVPLTLEEISSAWRGCDQVLVN